MNIGYVGFIVCMVMAVLNLPWAIEGSIINIVSGSFGVVGAFTCLGMGISSK